MTAIIEFQDLSVSYDFGKSTEVRALSQATEQILEREYVVFFGPSGCGKSTLLYAIAGLETPTQGVIRVLGKETSALSERERTEFHRSSVGMVFQAYHLVPSLSVKNNILLPQMFANIPRGLREQRCRDLMERFGIIHLADRRPSQLSGGQQQRVSIARALVNDPPIVLADEPVGNLDSENAETVMSLLSELNKRDGKTIVLVTHDPRHIHRADRVVYMKDGRLARTVRNPDREVLASASAVSKISELERIASMHPYLQEHDLRAKMLVRHLLSSLPLEQEYIMERAVSEFLLEKISFRDLKEILDKPQRKGGVGLYVQSASRLAQEALEHRDEIEKLKSPPLGISLEQEQAMELRGFLLDHYHGKLRPPQITNLEAGLRMRLSNKLDRDKLEKFLTWPEEKGGAALHGRTARSFAREVEFLLMKRNNNT